MARRKAPARQEVIDELSNEIREIAEAQRRALASSDAEVSKAFENVASNGEKLTESLAKGGASAAPLETAAAGLSRQEPT